MAKKCYFSNISEIILFNFYYSGAYDTEIEQKGPVEGFPDSKFVVTKIGCGKYKSISKDDVNGTTEWDFVYGDGTLCIVSFWADP